MHMQNKQMAEKQRAQIVSRRKNASRKKQMGSGRMIVKYRQSEKESYEGNKKEWMGGPCIV